MAWDKTKPAAGTSLRSSNPELLANETALETALNREHEFSTGGTAADQAHHKKGSARCYIQDAAPTTRVDGSAFNVQDNGSLWVDTNSSPVNQLNILTDYSTPTWTPVSTEVIATLLAAARTFASTLGVTGNFAVNTDKFTVTASNGNTAVAGTLGVTGIATLGDGSKNATSAAPDADAELANKKYVDDQDTAYIGIAGQFHDSSSEEAIFDTTMGSANTFQDLDLSSIVGSNAALVILEVKIAGSCAYQIRPNGEGGTYAQHQAYGYTGPNNVNNTSNPGYYYFAMKTDSSGIIEHGATSGGINITVRVLGYIK